MSARAVLDSFEGNHKEIGCGCHYVNDEDSTDSLRMMHSILLCNCCGIYADKAAEDSVVSGSGGQDGQ